MLKRAHISGILFLLIVIGAALFFREPPERMIAIEVLENDKIIGLLIKDNPQLKDELRPRLEAAFARGGDQALNEEAARIGVELAPNYFINYLPSASDEAVSKLLSVYRTELAEFRASGPEVCYHWMIGDRPDLVAEVASRGSSNDLDGAMLNLIASARDEAGDQVSLLTPDEFQLATQSLVQKVKNVVGVAIYSEELLLGAKVATTSAEKANFCAMITAFFDEMSDLPNPRDVAYARAFFSRGAALKTQ